MDREVLVYIDHARVVNRDCNRVSSTVSDARSDWENANFVLIGNALGMKNWELFVEEESVDNA